MSPAVAAARAVADAIRAKIEEGQGARTWRTMRLAARMLLCQVVVRDLKPPGDGMAEACRAWASFTDNERTELGALARQLRKDFEPAEGLR